MKPSSLMVPPAATGQLLGSQGILGGPVGGSTSPYHHLAGSAFQLIGSGSAAAAAAAAAMSGGQAVGCSSLSESISPGVIGGGLLYGPQQGLHQNQPHCLQPQHLQQNQFAVTQTGQMSTETTLLTRMLHEKENLVIPFK
ncbi:unnamed protein product [Protopolystoma xenopodis]|uniref:Uncharacterized protein n=1 Tax=Protopolystoma xenopodis TaxID=117903 RepID=A0A448WHJ3_9PLAT|nr:unnamed protein product [Protopolystoma xenopodis]